MSSVTVAARFLQGRSGRRVTEWRSLLRVPACKHFKNERHIPMFWGCRGCVTTTQPTDKDNSSSSGRRSYEKLREWWKGPTFKYWFIGGSAFMSWLLYYSLRAYKKTRIEVNLPPPLPSHYIVPRTDDLYAIENSLNSVERIKGKIRLISIQGPPGYGKSTLAYSFARKELGKMSSSRFSLPKSQTLAFLNASSIETFLPSLKGFASRLGITPADIKELCNGKSFRSLEFLEKCDILLTLIQEKLKKHPNWVLVVDNLMSTTPLHIRTLVQNWFVNTENAGQWSKGTVLLTDDGNYTMPEYKGRILRVGKGLSISDSNILLQELAKLSPSTVLQSEHLPKLLELLHNNPLAVVCAGIVLQYRLQEQPVGSVDGCIRSLCSEIERHVQNTMSSSRFGSVTGGNGESKVLATVEVVLAMAWNVIKTRNPYIVHSVDLLSNSRPGLPTPSLALSRYLKTPIFQLLPIEGSTPGIGNLFNKAKTEEKVDELEPIGKPLSNRRIVNWLYSVENWFQETWQVLKELYDLYKGNIELPEEDDGLGFLRDCELILTEKSEPGGVKSFQLHPCVYMVARQNLLSNTAPSLESRYLRAEQMKFNSRPWYKKMQPFDPSLTLEQFRKSLGASPENSSTLSNIVQAYNAPLFDLSGILLNKDEILRSTFDTAGTTSRFLHIQAHLSRILMAIEDAIHVAPQTLGGKTISRLLSSHLGYILQSQPGELIGPQSRINSFHALANVALSVENDISTARNLYQTVLDLQQQIEPEGSLAVAYTMTQIANLSILSDENEEAKELLDQATEIYEAHRKKYGEYLKPYDFGKCLSLLGVVCGTLGDKQRSKDLLERGLMLQQAGAPDLSDAAKGKQFGGEFAASLTDLGHAYIAMGLPLYGKKVLDLALAAHKNIHGETHPEVARALSLLSIAHLMQGHNEESKKLRREAGKINASIDALPSY